jgi:hypothetical protein
MGSCDSEVFMIKSVAEKGVIDIRCGFYRFAIFLILRDVLILLVKNKVNFGSCLSIFTYM